MTRLSRIRRCITRGVALVSVTAGLATGLAACGQNTNVNLQGTPGNRIVKLDAGLLPKQLLGLDVTVEDVTKTIENSRRAYIDSVALYGFRTDKLLQATLQISRFNADAKYNTDKFKQAVTLGVGSATGQSVQVGGFDVFLTLGSRQRIFEWFRGRFWFVLSVRGDMPLPRTLLRRLLEVNP